jgi:hypothetical protein
MLVIRKALNLSLTGNHEDAYLYELQLSFLTDHDDTALCVDLHSCCALFQLHRIHTKTQNQDQ